MDYNRASRPNMVSLFFGMAMAFTLITVLIASLFFNKLPQPQATDPALTVQSQQSGYTYNEAAATQTVHNKALLILVALGIMATVVITGIIIVGTVANRRVSNQIAQYDQYTATRKVALQYQQAYTPHKQQVIRTNRVTRR